MSYYIHTAHAHTYTNSTIMCAQLSAKHRQTPRYLNDRDSGAMGVRMVHGTLGATIGPPALME